MCHKWTRTDPSNSLTRVHEWERRQWETSSCYIWKISAENTGLWLVSVVGRACSCICGWTTLPGVESTQCAWSDHHQPALQLLCMSDRQTEMTTADGQLHTNSRCQLAVNICGLPLSESWSLAPCYQLNSFGRWCFAAGCQLTWNLLPDSLCDPELSLDTFGHQLKTYFWRDINEEIYYAQ